MKYIKSLDGLRAIAVLLVIFRHWHLPGLNLPFGWIGVNLFFVLSGYLITNGLILSKDQPLKKFLKVFYLKRVYRIFPIYYLFLLVAFVGLAIYAASDGQNEELIKAGAVAAENKWSLLFYTFNFHNLLDYFAGFGLAGSKMFGHIWSLAVEEQFYMVFPFIVFFFRKKALIWILLAVVVLSPFIRFFTADMLETYALNHETHGSIGAIIYKSTFTQLDALALGALLAVLGDKIRIHGRTMLITFLAIGAFFLFTVWLLHQHMIGTDWRTLGLELLDEQYAYNTGNWILDLKYTYSLSLINIMSAILILACVNGKKMMNFLENKVLVKIGQISYGIYLYHNPLYVLFTIGLFAFIPQETIEGNIFIEIGCFVVFLGLVYVISNASFTYIEKPFLKLKKKLSN